MISLSHYLILAAILFAISIVGIFLNRKNIIVILMAIAAARAVKKAIAGGYMVPTGITGAIEP